MKILAPTPRHYYGFVDMSHISRDGRTGWIPAAMFALHARTGRAFGISVHLHNNAIYRNLPPQAWSFTETDQPWGIAEAQTWDCLSEDISVIEIPYLTQLQLMVYIRGLWKPGSYLFSVEFAGGGWAETPEQNKAAHFIRLDNGRLTIQPGNRVLWKDPSFNKGGWWRPGWLKLQDKEWTCEEAEQWDETITDETG